MQSDTCVKTTNHKAESHCLLIYANLRTFQEWEEQHRTGEKKKEQKVLSPKMWPALEFSARQLPHLHELFQCKPVENDGVGHVMGSCWAPADKNGAGFYPLETYL